MQARGVSCLFLVFLLFSCLVSVWTLFHYVRYVRGTRLQGFQVARGSQIPKGIVHFQVFENMSTCISSKICEWKILWFQQEKKRTHFFTGNKRTHMDWRFSSVTLLCRTPKIHFFFRKPNIHSVRLSGSLAQATRTTQIRHTPPTRCSRSPLGHEVKPTLQLKSLSIYNQKKKRWAFVAPGLAAQLYTVFSINHF
jgi:hypothetical protein